ncbi:hypothetical protein M378DRAFT_174493 [Amanita muscaria Koide BX008]|uniref:Uncharacterized protein n=1 Tax=Amanita muscaria (strain Koide BX008) TaxID=946122 RepID=A0A0C2WDA7_AMAMK|nr:hypothetical protein M378DRAFT_174493 [Amanita muscaria Koide BX008]
MGLLRRIMVRNANETTTTRPTAYQDRHAMTAQSPVKLMLMCRLSAGYIAPIPRRNESLSAAAAIPYTYPKIPNQSPPGDGVDSIGGDKDQDDQYHYRGSAPGSGRKGGH